MHFLVFLLGNLSLCRILRAFLFLRRMESFNRRRLPNRWRFPLVTDVTPRSTKKNKKFVRLAALGENKRKNKIWKCTERDLSLLLDAAKHFVDVNNHVLEPAPEADIERMGSFNSTPKLSVHRTNILYFRRLYKLYTAFEYFFLKFLFSST